MWTNQSLEQTNCQLDKYSMNILTTKNYWVFTQSKEYKNKNKNLIKWVEKSKVSYNYHNKQKIWYKRNEKKIFICYFLSFIIFDVQKMTWTYICILVIMVAT